MLQRIQSLLLGIVTLLYILLFFIPVFVWNGYHTPNGEVMDTKTINALYNIPSIVLNAFIIIFSIFCITQFKNRKKQRSYVYGLCLLIILTICFYMFYLFQITIQKEYTLQPALSIGIYFQLLSIILCLVSARRIKKDDDLVKSIDRIR